MFLDGFLDHPVAFMLDAQGRRARGEIRGSIHPAPILIVGVVRTGRTNWVEGRAAETLVGDPDEWVRIADGLAGVGAADLIRAGLAPRTARAIRAGRPPTKRNAEAARRVVAKRARADAGLEPDRSPFCIAPGCEEHLRGRQRSFCTRHATFPGSRRRAWKEAAGR